MHSIVKNNPIWVLVCKGWEFAGQYRAAMVVYLVLFIAAEGTSLSEPYIIGKMLNCLQTGTTQATATDKVWHELLFYLVLFFCTQFLFWAFHGPGRVLERFVAFKIKASYKSWLFRTVTCLPMQWHREHHSGENIDKINRATASLRDFFDCSFEITYMMMRLIGAEVVLFFFMPFAGAVGIATTVLSFLGIYLFDKYLYRQYEVLNKYENNVASAIHDYVSNIASVITLRLESRVLKEVQRRIHVSLPLFQNNITVHELKWFLTSMLIAVMTLLVLSHYAFTQLSHGQPLMAGTFFTLLEYLRRIGESFYNFAAIYGTVVKQAADVKGAETIAGAQSAATHDGQDRRLPTDWQQVQIGNLHFRYEDEKHREHHVDGVSLSMEKGKKIAFVGESGSGKSTLLSLLRGIHDSDRCQVTCDGQQLEGKLRNLWSSTTLIPQDPEIFADTIRFNITFGIEAGDEEIMRVARLARFDSVLQTLSSGLDTNIAEKGVNLSGGQKQRLALARGIFFARDSDIILLDEPTSSVDAQNERQIYANLFQEFSDKCLISSIHKLHLLEMFDQIYVFRDGALVEKGSLPELLSRTGGALAAMRQSYLIAAKPASGTHHSAVESSIA